MPISPETLFDQHHRAVYRFLYRLTRRRDVAEDLTQECFLACIRAPERFDSARGSEKTLLFAIARNLALKHYRDHRPEAELEDNRAVEPVHDTDLAIEAAVSALPHLQQEALILFSYEGLTLEEIARVTGSEVGTVKNRLFRARENLKKALAPYKPIGDTHAKP